MLIIFAFSIAIRLYDLTDLPLDFHSTRQLLSLLKARGMYYETRTDVSPEERTFAIQQWELRASVEPEFFEHIVAWTYQFTGEQIWVARVYSSAFWIIGGIFLFCLRVALHQKMALSLPRQSIYFCHMPSSPVAASNLIRS